MARRNWELSGRTVLMLVALLVGADLLGRLGVGASSVQAAGGGVPDTAAQFQAMVDELRDVNKRLDTLQKYLESGKLTVKVEGSKEK